MPAANNERCRAAQHRLARDTSPKGLEQAGLQPITLQEARHTATTWLDAAGVPPKIASVLMGHATPERQSGAAQITLARYTHALPDDIERARDNEAPGVRQAPLHRHRSVTWATRRRS